MAILGYARVSTVGQSLELQLEQLAQARCSVVYKEKASGATSDRPALKRLLKDVRGGDVVLVTRLDRFARSARDLLNLTTRIRQSGGSFRSLAEALDTSTAVGHLIMTVLGAIAEYERSIILSRTSEGRASAVLKGVRFGRKPKLTPAQRREACERRRAGEDTHAIALSMHVSPTTILRIREESMK